LPEICQRCQLKAVRAGRTRSGDSTRDAPRQTLRFDPEAIYPPPWPYEGEQGPDEVEPDQHFELQPSSVTIAREAERAALKALPGTGTPWPRGADGNSRPTVSVLFSGGVFRGVYQMGVLNALEQLGVKPDVVAGASVGSITAAMVAEAFHLETETLRRARVARLAAVYLAIDRLLLTDRFADAVRNLTIRAADTRFSIRQVDRFLRKYDYPGFLEFDRNARRVVAGLERLLHLNPYQLNTLVRAARDGDLRTAVRTMQRSVQHLLDWMQIGEEALGADALVDLMNEYVPAAAATNDSRGQTIDEFRERTGIQLLATTTNLGRGRLEVLGRAPSPSGDSPTVREAILASSAFPGVFRPRWGWAIYPGKGGRDEYIDGGVMDNLPLDAVAAFLDRAAEAELILRSPLAPVDSGGGGEKSAEDREAGAKTVPHLVVGASLEINARDQALAFRRAELKQSWRIRGQRERQLSYNVKLDAYARTEERLRKVAAAARKWSARADGGAGRPFDPVDIHVLAVMPEWLCGTFAFHPMLGFRREKQAQSIAHGCASTLLSFAKLDKEHPEWLRAWKITRRLPNVSSWSAAFESAPRMRQSVKEGRCWLHACDCPFSRRSLEHLNEELSGAGCAPIPRQTVAEIAQIHAQCLRRETHLRQV
jgi:predicted acylesterase/phospholipase RssA